MNANQFQSFLSWQTPEFKYYYTVLGPQYVKNIHKLFLC